MNKTFPLATTTWDQREFSALQKVIESNKFSMGTEVSKFEKKFANFFSTKYAVMTNSGSSANLIMIASLFYSNNSKLKLKRGDEVIVPAVAWSTSYYPLTQYGLKLVFVDIDLETLNYDIDSLRLAISDKTRLIMAVNLLGNSNEFDKIFKIINGSNIVLVEDNCESMGAKFNGKYTGTFGLMGTFSTFFSHHISTMEGGVVVTDDEEMYHLLLSLRAHGWTRNLPQINKITGNKDNDEFKESFKFVLPGYNVRPIEMAGAIGVEQIEKINSIVKGRRKNAVTFKKYFSKNNFLLIQSEVGESSWFGFSLIIKQNSLFNIYDLRKVLDQLGFEYRPIVAGDFTQNPVMKYINHKICGSLKNARYLNENGLFIGNHHYSISEGFESLYKKIQTLT
jgi:CDP-6-deoxy-D-xylo-4-hexulose-3-dehydrase